MRNFRLIASSAAFWPLLFFFVLSGGLGVWGLTPFVHRATVDATDPRSPLQLVRLTVRDVTPAHLGPPDVRGAREVSIRVVLRNQSSREVTGIAILVRAETASGVLLREVKTLRSQLAAEEILQIDLPLIRGYRVSDVRVQVLVEYDS